MKGRLNNTVTTLVGADATVEGNLLFGRGCHVAGLVRGDVLAAGNGKGKKSELTVAQGGKVEGNAQAGSLLIQGTVLGDLSSDGTVSLAASARAEGSIEYGEIEIEKGAVVTGSLGRKRVGADRKTSLLSGRRDKSSREKPDLNKADRDKPDKKPIQTSAG